MRPPSHHSPNNKTSAMPQQPDTETLNAMALSRIDRFHPAGILELYNRLGSATSVIEHRNNIREVIPDASRYLTEGLGRLDDAMKRAEEEMEYDLKHHIVPLAFHDKRYPERMRQCPDAPLVLYFLGNADLNNIRTINIVGTRRCTPYGKDLIKSFIDDLKELCPGILIFSGLAYGVDICAHREALADGFDTVGVLAHGLDDIYPKAHRSTAIEMLQQGGLLTEYMTRTEPFAKNFVRRNRIVAGCSDATILVESASHGGGLITCSIARSYNRDVFAFPGSVGATYSEGCNNLIRDNGATLITSAADFVKAMMWDDGIRLQKARKSGIQRDLFPNLSDDEKAIVSALAQTNDQQLNALTITTSMPINRLSSLLFELELKGIVRPLAGGAYHLIM